MNSIATTMIHRTLLLQALLAALVSSETTTTVSHRELRPKFKITCLDDPDFTHRNKESKTCAWINSLKKNKKHQLCTRDKIHKACQYTCGVCPRSEGEETIDIKKCPKKIQSIIFGEDQNGPCNGYATDLRCEYGHFLSGCNADEPACTPIMTYTCDVDPSTSEKAWNAQAAAGEVCEDKELVYEKGYGDSCNPKECLPVPPKAGTDCSWYQGSEDCPYNYQFAGCEVDDHTCVPLETYHCDKDTKKWVVEEGVIEPCPVLAGFAPEPDLRRGHCDLAALAKECPRKLPEGGSSCAEFEGDQDCYYDYQIQGCLSTQLDCVPSMGATCDKVTNEWTQFAIDPAPCKKEPEGLPIGQACDPKDCPVMKPEGDCSDYTGNEICSYDYEITGCNSWDLQCAPTTHLVCNSGTNRWEDYSYDDGILQDLCPDGSDPNLPIGQACDPHACPPSEPTGEDCSQYQGSEDCNYGYTTLGCDPESLTCEPTVFSTCDRFSYTWHTSMVRKLGLENCPGGTRKDLNWGTECDVVKCPLAQPQDGSDCSGWGGDRQETCYYGHEVRGCTPWHLTCQPTVALACQEGDDGRETWVDQGVHLVECIADDPSWGTECVPECPLEVPEEGSACSTASRCYYNYEVFGCDEESLQCQPTEQAICTEDGWQVDLVPQARCYFDHPAMGTPCRQPWRYDPKDYPSDGNRERPGDDASDAATDERDEYKGRDRPKITTCPREQPTANDSCANYDLDEACGYNYMVYGCTYETMTCDAINWATCDNGRWTVLAGAFAKLCEPGWKDGSSCDPEDFDPYEYPPDPTKAPRVRIPEPEPEDPFVGDGGGAMTPPPSESTYVKPDPYVGDGGDAMTPPPSESTYVKPDPYVGDGDGAMTPPPSASTYVKPDPYVGNGGDAMTPPPSESTYVKPDPYVGNGDDAMTPPPSEATYVKPDPYVGGGGAMTPPPSEATYTKPEIQPEVKLELRKLLRR